MGFYIFHRDPQRVPRPQLIKLANEETWVGFHGSREGLLTSQRAERWIPKEQRCPSLGPQWFDKDSPWDCTAPTSAIGETDPVAPLFRPTDSSALDRNGNHYHLEIARARELQDVIKLFGDIAQKLTAAAPVSLVESPKKRVGPAPFDSFELFTADVSSEVVLQRVAQAKEAAMDRVSFVAWWTLLVAEWEAPLEDPQREVVRRCEFRSRPKRGCLLDLLFDCGYTNFELWMDWGVPFYYQWTEALKHSPRFNRADPVMLEDYYHHANDLVGASPEFPLSFLEACKEEDYDILSFDNFFQSKHERDDLVDTDYPEFSSGVYYKFQAFQGWFPLTLTDRTQIERFIASYECFPAGLVNEDVMVIVRWAPRRDYMGTIEDEEYTADDGQWDTDTRFPGRTFDRTTGWFSNDVLVLRELLRPIYAPSPGAFYSPRGVIVQGGFHSVNERRWYEQQLIDGTPEEDIHQRDYHRPPTSAVSSDSEVPRLSLAERLSVPGLTAQPASPGDVETFQAATASERASSRLSLLDRLSSPTRAQRRAEGNRSANTSDAVTAEGEVSSAGAASETPSSSSDSSIGPRDPRFDMGQALRYAEPHPIAANPRRISTVYSRAYADYELYLSVCRAKVKRLANAIIGPPRPLYANRLRPSLAWSEDVISSAILVSERPIERIRILLLPRLDTRLDSPSRVLDRSISGGYKIRLAFLRDPVPKAPLALRGVEPSSNTASELSASKSGKDLYKEWVGAVRDLWTRTHAHAFLYEGGVLNYVIRHCVPEEGFSEKAGRGVCMENRLATSTTMYLPDGLSRVAVYDNVSDEERHLLNGRVKGLDGVYRWILPPQELFEVDGSQTVWEVGTGEWSLCEEDYLDDLMESWKTGSGRLRTMSGWESHARQRARSLVKRNPSLARDTEAYPTQGDARAWAELLQALYGGLPTKVRDVSGLARRDDLSAVVMFGE